MKYEIKTKSDIEEAIRNFSEGDSIIITPKTFYPMVTGTYFAEGHCLYPNYEIDTTSAYTASKFYRKGYNLFTKTLFEICTVLGLNIDDYSSFEDVLAKEGLILNNKGTGRGHRLRDEASYLPMSIFCPSCFKHHTIDDLSVVNSSKEFKEFEETLKSESPADTIRIIGIVSQKSNNGLIFKCPDCGEEFFLQMNKNINVEFNSTPKFIPKKIYVDYKDNKFSVAYNGIFNYWDAVRSRNNSTTESGYGKDWIIRTFKGKGKMVMNLESGQSYLLPIRTPSGKILKRNTINNPAHLTNITYSTKLFYDSTGLLTRSLGGDPIVSEIISKVMAKVINHTQEEEDIYSRLKKCNVSEMINLLARKTRYPNIPIDNLYNSLGKPENIYSVTEKRFLKRINKDASFDELLDFAVKYTQMADEEWVRDEIASNVLNAVYLRTLNDIGFTNKTYIQTLLTIIHKYNSSIGFESPIFTAFSSFHFIRDIIKNCKGTIPDVEQLAVDIIYDLVDDYYHNYQMCEDCERFYRKVMQSSLSYMLCSPTIYRGKTISSIMDELENLYDIAQYEDYKIFYKKEDISNFCNIVGNYDFRLVESTHELIRVGQHLKVNIGGDFNEAQEKRVSYVVAYDIYTREPVFYLKFMRERLMEARTSLNQTIRNEAAEALKEWVEDLGDTININRCTDYRHIEENDFSRESYTKGYDNHVFEIDANGKVVKV